MSSITVLLMKKREEEQVNSSEAEETLASCTIELQVSCDSPLALIALAS